VVFFNPWKRGRDTRCLHVKHRMGAQRNIRLVLEYDGGGYHGWQIQPQVLTIQEVLEDRIQRITQQRSRVIAAGRTDAGVHALQQVANFRTRSALPVETLQRALNALLPPDIRVWKADEVDASFHARFTASTKRYEYRIWNGPVPSAFSQRYTWWLPAPLDLEAMEAASKYLVGVHDFSSFRSANADRKSPVREVRWCGWGREGPLLFFCIEASGFLRYMVRSMVGTLVEVGMGKRRADDIPVLLEARDRTRAGMTAPARGLFLAAVSYPPPWQLDSAEAHGLLGIARCQGALQGLPPAGTGNRDPGSPLGDGGV
jgi:tRNA pseudouridine38-40 synthase